MRKIILVSILLTAILTCSSAYAQIQNYYVDTSLDESGKSLVKLAISIAEPIDSFQFTTLGQINDLVASSNNGPINCYITTELVSHIQCTGLDKDLRMIYINFTTMDFVRVINNKYYFSADYTLNKNLNLVSIFVRLPEGMVVSGTTTNVIFPENSTMVSDGRRHIITWQLSSIAADQPLRFQILYEQSVSSPLFQLRLRHFLVFGVAAAAVFAFIYYFRFFRKPEELVLSVLDEYEKMIMNSIINAGGVLNQKVVVKETNLSKAKVSRVVKSLVGRGLIDVERIGRTNKLKLIKKKLKI